MSTGRLGFLGQECLDEGFFDEGFFDQYSKDVDSLFFFIKNNIEIAIVAIVAVSLLPVAIEMLRHRKQLRHG